MASNAPAINPGRSRGGTALIRTASTFFSDSDRLFRTLVQTTDLLARLGISYAVADSVAMLVHGGTHVMEELVILLRKDTALDWNDAKPLPEVPVRYVYAGDFPGGRKPKPIKYPDPEDAGVEIDDIRYLKLPKLIELKLASGMSALHRIKDLADVQELIRVLALPREMAEQLDPTFAPSSWNCSTPSRMHRRTSSSPLRYRERTAGCVDS